MPETTPITIRAPIGAAPTVNLVRRWSDCLALLDAIIDKSFAIDLQSECLNSAAVYAASKQVSLSLPGAIETEKRRGLFRDGVYQFQSAVSRVRSWEYGLRWRDGDFDILSPPEQQIGALFIPLMIGGLILAGCFATAYHLGKNADELLIDYQRLNKAADSALCSNPNSELCKGWQVVKEAEKIPEKMSFAESLKGGISKGITAALALIGGLFALSIFRR
jgi:hypothetical protein